MERPEGDLDEIDEQRVMAGMGALWIPVFVASFGMAVVILLSLWVSGWRNEQALIAQFEPQWRVGEQLALRVLHIDGERQPLAGSQVTAVVFQEGHGVQPLGEFADAGEVGVLQGRFTVPTLAPGPAAIGLEVAHPGLGPLREWIAVEVVDERPQRQGALTISTSNLNWGDNTEPQPEGMQIVVRPERRLLAGFDNTLMIRVTDPDGNPRPGHVEVALLGGEFMAQRGSSREPPILLSERTDALGLAMLRGALTSEILEIEVRIVEPGEVFIDEGRVLGRRRFRMVSFAGAVRLEGEPLALRAGEPASIAARGLRRSRPIYVDVHGTDGAWVDTLEPVVGLQPPRQWSTAGVEPGFIQAEAYYFTNDPGESAEILRLQITDDDPGGVASLRPVVDRYHALLDAPRVEKSFDRESEAAFVAYLGRAELSEAEVKLARRFLVGTLPIQVIGPPLAITTFEREQADLVAAKVAWYSGLRWGLLGGGGLFLLLLALLILVRHGSTAKATAEALGSAGDDPEIAAAINSARRGALVRMWAVVVVMGLGLVLVAVALERIVWRV
ncbi:MAG: hypothetical protein KC486_23730 [Myxococcales bacterium]|nr:hypothetical protein [Myxococcales bacterium]